MKRTYAQNVTQALYILTHPYRHTYSQFASNGRLYQSYLIISRVITASVIYVKETSPSRVYHFDNHPQSIIIVMIIAASTMRSNDY